ncbi:pyridoxamine 5'-phosphate oxidase family protein [Agromyces protaetiae]|uniref:Pyridoxamine 5'-phosphate oxidase family protein n=1 Tax=Agromyces protaetiae TaxID=2509455 RepID=A0A4V0YHI6_9MICO|nr:pyridoxamine 5'-phosphate oxidase family protein [Agromyces protaetiae]
METDRRIRRLSERQTFDRAELHRLLDEQLVGHLAATHHGAPIVVPMAFARVGDAVLLHGSTGGGFALRAAAERTPVAFAVTSLDAIVVARSLYDHSMNYRSAMIYGVLEEVADEASALDLLSEKLLPGRKAEVRENTRKELAATRVLRLALDDVVMKMRAAGAGEAEDDGEDHSTWAGIVPLAQSWGDPVASVLTPAGTPVPDSVRALKTATAYPPRL